MRTAIDKDLSDLIGPSSWTGLGLTVRRTRDLVLVDVADRTIVIATDSNAAIGRKPFDHLAQDPFFTGYSAAKVPLMEVVAVGASPFLVVDNLGVELRPTGLDIIRGIRSVLDEIGLDDIMITGSDESNMPTQQTGLGVTVLGSVITNAVRVGVTEPGDDIWLVGRRASGLPGDEYDPTGPDIARLSDVVAALRMDGVHEALPVGSHGVAHECLELATSSGLRFERRTSAAIDFTKSAGASTCFLVSCAPDQHIQIANPLLPIHLVGRAVAS